MKTIGLIGGTGWLSTLEYYQKINVNVNQKLGGLQAAKIILNSINFGELNELNQKNDIMGVQKLILNAVETIVNCKVDGIALCANTLHLFAPIVSEQYSLPLIHIGEVTAKGINNKGFKKAGLLGTLITMEHDFYKQKLADFSIETILPDKKDRNYIHHIIMHELMKGIVKQETKNNFIEIIKKLQSNGAECVILGCTEIPLLINHNDVDIPLINTLDEHCKAIADWIIN